MKGMTYLKYSRLVGVRSMEDHTDFFALVVAVISFCFTGYVFLKQRKTQRYSGTAEYNASWQTFNQLVVGDTDFQDFEAELHPYEDLSRKDVKRIYFHFLRFNVAYAAFSGASEGELEAKLAESSLANLANVSFHDREFIKKHVFARGYNKAFANKFNELWLRIERNGMTLPMQGDEKGEYNSAMKPKPQPQQADGSNSQ